MSFNVYVRSAHAKCLPASVRPSGVSLYFQLDNWHTEGELLNQSEIATINTRSPLDITPLGQIRVVNCFKSIKDVVLTQTNNESESDVVCMEDGRSRRYLLGLGSFYQIVSLPIGESQLPISFANRSTKPGLTTGVTTQIRFFRYGDIITELLLIFIGGKNHLDDELHTISDYREDIACYVETFSDVKRSAKLWKSQTSSRKREYIILHYKDHSSPAESFDCIGFYRTYSGPLGLLEHVNPESKHGSGSRDIIGSISSSPHFSISVELHGYDDHFPAAFAIHTPYHPLPQNHAIRLSNEYLITKYDNLFSTARSHGKSTRLSDIEYRKVRLANPIEYR